MKDWNVKRLRFEVQMFADLAKVQVMVNKNLKIEIIVKIQTLWRRKVVGRQTGGMLAGRKVVLLVASGVTHDHRLNHSYAVVPDC